ADAGERDDGELPRRVIGPTGCEYWPLQSESVRSSARGRRESWLPTHVQDASVRRVQLPLSGQRVETGGADRPEHRRGPNPELLAGHPATAPWSPGPDPAVPPARLRSQGDQLRAAIRVVMEGGRAQPGCPRGSNDASERPG